MAAEGTVLAARNEREAGVTGKSGAPAGASAQRKVRWRKSQIRAFALGALLCLAAASAIMGWAILQGRNKIAQQNHAELTQGAITRHWREGSGPSARYMVAFRYPQLPADQPDQTMQVASPLIWAEMSPGKGISTSYFPAAPASNGMQGNRPHLFRKWLWTGGAASGFAVLLPLVLYIARWRRKRAEFWLVGKGKSAVGEVTDVIETMYRKGEGARWYYEVSYRFSTPAGLRIEGSRKENGLKRKNWNIGDIVTVFFDPQNPERNGLYTDLSAEVVSSE